MIELATNSGLFAAGKSEKTEQAKVLARSQNSCRECPFRLSVLPITKILFAK
jgi:hypothetical protein